jgi:hypothetical protein
MNRNSSAHQGGRTGGAMAGANVRNAGAQKSALPRAGASRASGGGKKR